MPEIHNWFGDLGSTPAKMVSVGSAAEIAAVLKDEAKYPSPVRAIGSGHSCTECGEAEGGEHTWEVLSDWPGLAAPRPRIYAGTATSEGAGRA